MPSLSFALTDNEILAARTLKVAVDPWRPIASLIEPERQADGRVVDVVTLFLANRECPFHCVYCDLWKQTLDELTPAGAVPQQIDVAFSELAADSLAKAQAIKLYNSGNFFDAAAIPPTDWSAIADRVRRFERVIVENHPRLIDERAVRFRDLLETRLEVAMGLETIHPDVLPRLNKRMTVEDFARAARFLTDHDIDVRAFVLLRPPFLSEAEGIEWALRSVMFAFDHGATCVSVIPTRANNGLMEQMQSEGLFAPPTLRSLEYVHETSIRLGRGRVFADIWDAAQFADCHSCVASRLARMQAMNQSQTVQPPIACSACNNDSQFVAQMDHPHYKSDAANFVM